jgi:hypothetical protein
MLEINHILIDWGFIMNKIESFLKELKTNKRSDIIDNIVHWTEKNSIEIELVAEYLKKDSVLISSLQIDAENLNYLKKNSRLPV